MHGTDTPAPINNRLGHDCRYLRFKPTAAGAVTWVSPSLQSIDAFTGNLLGNDSQQGANHVLNLTIDIPRWCGKWVVTSNEFKDGVVGAKSKNLANLRGKIPDWIRLPSAVTVPFGSFEQVRTSSASDGFSTDWLFQRM